ncbi:hypothetical protein KP509_17G009400 [Ceratopteris richardii]|uniref:Uncharacterized protein n=1 Tax=Ceratopteris richardii TaxID=49495 RepID=A0A8T2STK1_CERRI|nr:hypothetical protein KP509_17G009400 [Ceratopteris richardii]
MKKSNFEDLQSVETPPGLSSITCSMDASELQADNPSRPSSRKVCFSFAAYAKNVIQHLRRCNISITEGLTNEEFCKIESTFGFEFPPDLEAILRQGLPVGEGFPQWRDGSHAEIKSWLDWPVKVLCSEVRHGKFWSSLWGVIPENAEVAVQRAIEELKKVPTLVPVYASCYISCSPVQAGNPVFLVQESTILYCGYDLADFFKRQAFVPRMSKTTSRLAETKLHSGKDQLKYQRNLQMNIAGEPSDVVERLSNPDRTATVNGTRKPLSAAIWRWADESPRISIDVALHPDAVSDHYYREIKEHVLSSVVPSAPPPTPAPSSISSSSSFSSSSPSSLSSASNKNSPSASGLYKESSPFSLSSASSSLSYAHEDQRTGIIPKKYLYLYEGPLPSRMLNRYTMAAPPWTATQARKITFWSDVADVSCPSPTLSTSSLETVGIICYKSSASHDSHESKKYQEGCPCHDLSEANVSDHHLQSSSYPASEDEYEHQQSSDHFELVRHARHHGVRENEGGRSNESIHVCNELGEDQNCCDCAYISRCPSSRNFHGVHPFSTKQHCDSETAYIDLHQFRGSSCCECENGYNHNQFCCCDSQNSDLYVCPASMPVNSSLNNNENLSNTWLSTYLSGLADVLRRGRWGEADIKDMLHHWRPRLMDSTARVHYCT